MSSIIADVLVRLLSPPKREAEILRREFLTLEASTQDVSSAIGPRGQVNRLSGGNVVFDKAEGIILQNPASGVKTVWLEPDGDARFGSDLSKPEATSLSIFSNAQDYNGEAMGAGDVLLGDNSADKANMIWDRSAGKIIFRGGTTEHAYIDTTGKLMAGSGAVVLDSAGITANAGTIAGWTISSSQIKKNGIILDSAQDQILIGGASGIILDGANARIQSFNFASGYAGFTIDGVSGDAEFNNITARGKLSSVVFEQEVISSVGGALMIMPSDLLDEDMDSLDGNHWEAPFSGTHTLVLAGNVSVKENDILRIKDGVNDEWFWVQGDPIAENTYLVTRDKAGSYAADQNPAWKRGAVVLNYGTESANGGGILLDSDGPDISVFTHGSSPWSVVAEHVRLGNLNGSFGVTSDLWGIGIGGYHPTAGDYLLYEPQGGFVLKAGGGNISLDSDGLTLATGATTGSQVKWKSGDDITLNIYGGLGVGSGEYMGVIEAPTISGAYTTEVVLRAGALGTAPGAEISVWSSSVTGKSGVSIDGNLRATGDIYTTAWTDYSDTSTITGWSSLNTNQIYYKRLGNLVFVDYNLSGPSNSSTTSFTLPFPATSVITAHSFSVARAMDNGAWITTTNPFCHIVANGSTLSFYKDGNGSLFTGSGNKALRGFILYERG